MPLINRHGPARAEQRHAFGLGRLEEMHEKALVSSSTALLAEVLHQQGRYSEAARLGDRSKQMAAPDDLAAQIAWRTVQAKILTTTGRLEDTETLARHAVALAAETDWSTYYAAARVALGEVLRDCGRTTGDGRGNPNGAHPLPEKGKCRRAEEVHALLAKLMPA